MIKWILIALLIPSSLHAQISNTTYPVKIVGFGSQIGPISNTVLPILLPPGTQAYVAAPLTPTDACIAGQYAADASYFYICEATNTWLRGPIATWSVGTQFLLLASGGFLLLQGGGKIILN